MSRLSQAFNVLLGRESNFNTYLSSLSGGTHPSYNKQNADKISTVYTCVKILGETVGRLPLSTYRNSKEEGRIKDHKHYLHDILAYNPNNYTSSNSFFCALEVNRGLDGNGYARIWRDGNAFVKKLTIINSNYVVATTIVDGELKYKVYSPETGKYEILGSNDILHFRLVTRDGINGINPIEALRLNLSTTWEAMGTIDTYYKNNAVNPKALKSTVQGNNQTAMIEALNLVKSNFKGHKGAGEIVVLPPNSEIQELQMNPIDAAFLSMIEFNANQISALFGIPAHLVGNTVASKYSSIEQTQLGYKVNTVSPITRMYRQELELKLLTAKERQGGESIEFNLMALVETDHKSRIEGYQKLLNMGAITQNQIAKLEGYEAYSGGDNHWIQSSMVTVEGSKEREKAKITKT